LGRLGHWSRRHVKSRLHIARTRSPSRRLASAKNKEARRRRKCDGIGKDFLEFNSGTQAVIGIAEPKGLLVQ
jgi:hypothetical protein